MSRPPANNIVAGALRGRVFGGSGQSKGERSKKIALEQLPNGSIKSAEIENEKGHLVWSFDISKPGTRNITELLVDLAPLEQRFYCPLIIRTSSDLAPVCTSTVKMFPTPGA